MTDRSLSLTVSSDQPLIGLVFEENGQEVIRYFADEATSDAATGAARFRQC